MKQQTEVGWPEVNGREAVASLGLVSPGAVIIIIIIKIIIITRLSSWQLHCDWDSTCVSLTFVVEVHKLMHGAFMPWCVNMHRAES